MYVCVRERQKICVSERDIEYLCEQEREREREIMCMGLRHRKYVDCMYVCERERRMSERERELENATFSKEQQQSEEAEINFDLIVNPEFWTFVF